MARDSYLQTVETVLSEYNFPKRMIDRAVGIATVTDPQEIDTRTMSPWQFVPHQTLDHCLRLAGVRLSSRSLYRICDRLGFQYIKVSNARFYPVDEAYILCPINTNEFPDEHEYPMRMLWTVEDSCKLLGLKESALRARSDYRGGSMYKTVLLKWPGYERRFWVVDPKAMSIATP